MTAQEPEKIKLVRGWISKRAALITLVAILFIGVSFFAIFNALRPAPIPVTYAYFYDLGSNAVFVDNADKVPPFAAPSGKAGPKGEPLAVRAFIYSCTTCDDPSKQYLAYLQQYTPEAQKRVIEFIAANTTIDADNMQADPRNSGFVIRAPEGGLWYLPDSQEGDEIVRTARSKCGRGSFPSPCFPVK